MAVKIYSGKNVFDAALDRIRWIFREFDNVIVSSSGGKDSTVVFELALIVAREMNRLPLTVFWMDQEAEWQQTVDYVQSVMERPEVNPRWFQIPIRLFNASSHIDHWLNCWDEKDEAKWMHPRWERAVTENKYGTDRFHEMFPAIARGDYPGQKVCYLAGMRTEESPTRYVSLTWDPTYGGRTWGKKLNPEGPQVTMYPIYDWSYTDVWKAIHSNGWRYNTVYDELYRYGVSVKNMRVSNVHHETAVTALFLLQEIEPETYARLTQRISGADTAGKLGKADYFVRELPFMFASWKEYRDYLFDNLIKDPVWRKKMRSNFDRQEEVYVPTFGDKVFRLHVQSILTNDWECIKLINWERGPGVFDVRQAWQKERGLNPARKRDGIRK